MFLFSLMNATNNLSQRSLVWVLIIFQLLFASNAMFTKDSGFHEINIGFNDGLRVQDSSGVNEWSYISMPALKRCDFRQINILCMEGTDTTSTDTTSATASESQTCQLNCMHRGYKLGICYTSPGPGTETSGEWQRARGVHRCYCSLCDNEKCMHFCHTSGAVTGYCHESPSYGAGCKCVGCETSLCSKHCHDVYGNALQQPLCKSNECKCLAKRCDDY